MPASRRSLTYLFIGAAVIVVAALLYRNFPSQSAKTAQTGQLFQAVANYKAHSSDRANTISSDPNQAAEIQGDGQTVLWFAADGTRYTTTASSGGLRWTPPGPARAIR